MPGKDLGWMMPIDRTMDTSRLTRLRTLIRPLELPTTTNTSALPLFFSMTTQSQHKKDYA